jgi:hypothetical protein
MFHGVARQERLEGAMLAARLGGSTEVFAHHHKLGMVILPKVDLPAGLIPAEGGLAGLLELGIGGTSRTPPMPDEDPGGIGVDDKRMPAAGIEQETVGCLRSNSMDCQKPLPGLPRCARPHALEFSVVLVDENLEEGSEPAGFDAEIAGWADQAGQLGLGEPQESAGFEKVVRSQVVEGAFDVRPIRILSENGADADLERRFSGPPLLMTEVCTQQTVRAPKITMRLVGPKFLRGHSKSSHDSGSLVRGQAR